jgi:type IV secretion system protein VirD4
MIVRGSYQDSYAAFGPPRSGKTVWMAQVGLEAPGACLFTSTRADLARDTAKARLRHGPVWFLNPGGDGGFPSTLRYTPLAGCEDSRMATESAGALMHAAPLNTDGASNWIDDESADLLQYLLHAAALAGGDIFTVRRWGARPHDAGVPVKILDASGNPRWAEALEDMSAHAAADPQYGQGLAGGIRAALKWLDDRELEHLACPPPGAEFDVRQFIRDQGTVYVIGADSEHCALSPYFACLATHVWNTAKRMAADPAEEASADLMLDPPLTMVIDEPVITCPVPLGRWATEAGGHGITLVTGFQSDAQLPQKFGEHGGKALEDIITVKLVFGGVTGAIAGKAAGWGGKHDTWFAHKKDIRQVDTFPAERICGLPLGQAFVKHRNTRAFIAAISHVRDHPSYEEARPEDFAPLPPPARVALEPPRRDAIVTPYQPALNGEEEPWPSPAPVSSAA